MHVSEDAISRMITLAEDAEDAIENVYRTNCGYH